MSWIVARFDVVISSSSFRRSLMGRIMRCTYFLLVNGWVTRFRRLGSSPSQKSVAGAGSGSVVLSAYCEEGAAWVDVLVCWARPGNATAVDTSSVTNVRFT